MESNPKKRKVESFANGATSRVGDASIEEIQKSVLQFIHTTQKFDDILTEDLLNNSHGTYNLISFM
jgi:hypothetical protein